MCDACACDSKTKDVDKSKDLKDACDPKDLKFKTFKLDIKRKPITRDGKQYGTISGYASTYGNVDRGGDIIEKGAFTKSLARYKQSDRMIRMYWQHNRDKMIGGFPIEKVVDDNHGLFVEGEINLSVPEGNSTYELAIQGAVTDFSIGYSIKDAEENDDGNLVLKELELWEISAVGEPMNPEATITGVKDIEGATETKDLEDAKEEKGATPFKDLPLADRGRRWSASEAAKRVRVLTGSEDNPSATYKNAFLWVDSANSDKFGAYKLPFADVVDGKLTAVPRAIFAAAARLNQTDIPDADKEKVAANINKYYKKMGLESPLKANGELEENFAWIAEIFKEAEVEETKEVEDFDCMKDIENFLKKPASLTSSARKILISKIKSFSREAEDDEGVRDVRDQIEEKASDEPTEVEQIEVRLEARLEARLIEAKLDKINNLLKGEQ